MSLEECARGFYGFLIGLQEGYAIGTSFHMGFEGCGHSSAKAGGEIIADQGDFLLAARDLAGNFVEGFLRHRHPTLICGVL
jgi:hypothetical protein